MTVAPSTRVVATPANAVTALRIVLAPVVIVFIWLHAPSWWVLAFGFFAMITDQLDGWLARRYGASDIGKMLDPIADKVMVIGALFVLAAMGWVAWLPVAIITAREVAMSWYRAKLARRGVMVTTRKLARYKTWSQSVAVAAALVPGVVDDHRWLLDALLWSSVALTVVTFVQYMKDGHVDDRGKVSVTS